MPVKKLSSDSSEEGKSAFRILSWAFGPLRDATTKLVVASLFFKARHQIDIIFFLMYNSSVLEYQYVNVWYTFRTFK